MKTRQVIRKLYGHMVDMGGTPVRQPLPTKEVNQIDPFLLFHHGSFAIPQGIPALQAGVGPHPHRGFSPVTIVLNGEVHHRDSLGNSSVVGAGGVQWINAGRGIIHSERPSIGLAEAGGKMEVIQLWINTPKAEKLAPAAYQSAQSDQLPRVSGPDGSYAQVIAGEYDGLTGPMKASSELSIVRIAHRSNQEWQISIPAGHHAALYVIAGKANLALYGELEEANLYEFDMEGDGLILSEGEGFDAVLLTGKPLDEPMANYGPFVMNTQTEIMEALRDYQQGKMGVLIEE